MNKFLYFSVSFEDGVLEGASDLQENRREYNVAELISFASFDCSNDSFKNDQTTIPVTTTVNFLFLSVIIGPTSIFF